MPYRVKSNCFKGGRGELGKIALSPYVAHHKVLVVYSSELTFMDRLLTDNMGSSVGEGQIPPQTTTFSQLFTKSKPNCVA